MDALLLVANDLFHRFEHRIKDLSVALQALMPLEKMSLVPPGTGPSGEPAPPRALVRGWPLRVLLQREPLVWSLGDTIAVRRAPLPGPMGPVANCALLRSAIRRIDPRRQVALAQGPVPARACIGEGIRFIYDHADDYGGGRVGALHRKVLGSWQQQALRHAMAVSCAGPSLYRHALESGAGSACLHPNGVHTRLFELPRSETASPTMLYFGGVERDCGLDAVLHAMKLIGRDVRLMVGGGGSAMRRFVCLASRLGVASRVTWLGGVSRLEAPRLMAEAWIGLALFAPTRWNRSAFHLKILEYMAAGLPFVTTPVGDGAQMAQQTGAGRVAGHDAAAVATCLENLLADRAARREMSQRGRNAATAHDWALVGPRFAHWVAATVATTV